MHEKKLYLLEDDKAIAELITCAMEISGVACLCFYTCADFLAAAEKQAPDVAILDIMLPDGSGLDVLKTLKSRCPDMPVLMLSALGRESDKVKGLNLGADDYVSKPFGVLELSARVKALLRRVPSKSIESADEETKRCGALLLNPAQRTVTFDGESLVLNHKEFDLLSYFMSNEKVVLSRDQLLSAVWGYDFGGGTRTVDNHVARLRKLGLNQYLTTVFGAGYKFENPLESK